MCSIVLAGLGMGKMPFMDNFLSDHIQPLPYSHHVYRWHSYSLSSISDNPLLLKHIYLCLHCELGIKLSWKDIKLAADEMASVFYDLH